jgi:hypothetical protein
MELPLTSVVALKLCAAVYSCAVLTTATLVPTVADPVLIVRSPTRVVEKLPIVPVVEFSVAIVPWVRLAEPWLIFAVLAVSVCTVPLVMLPAVDVVVPAVRFVIVAAVPVVVPAVRFEIVAVEIVAFVLTVLLPVELPYVKPPERVRFVKVPEVNASSTRFWTVTFRGARDASTLSGAMRSKSAVPIVVISC